MSSSAWTPPAFVTSLLSHYDTLPALGPYPRVTLTFAQSLDAKIGKRDGQQLILSGKESMLMTHWSVHAPARPSPADSLQDPLDARRDPYRHRHRTQRRPPAQ